MKPTLLSAILFIFAAFPAHAENLQVSYFASLIRSEIDGDPKKSLVVYKNFLAYDAALKEMTSESLTDVRRSQILDTLTRSLQNQMGLVGYVPGALSLIAPQLEAHLERCREVIRANSAERTTVIQETRRLLAQISKEARS